MALCYVTFTTHTHAFFIERGLKINSIPCEITYLPRNILIAPCNMGVKFDEKYIESAAEIIKQSRLPRVRVYKEIVNYDYNYFVEINI